MKRSISTMMVLLLIGTLHAQVRQQLTINSNWQFYQGDITESADEISWEPINIPHTWNALDMLDDEPGYYRGPAWYRKELRIPSDMEGRQVFLYFEGANQDATIFVNGKEVGKHFGGYTAFCFDITKHLEQDKNVLRVRLDNRLNAALPPVGGDLGHFGGIYRDVSLIAMDPSHFDIEFFASGGVFVTTPEVNEETAMINIESRLVNATGKKLHVRHELYSSDGTLIQQSTAKSTRHEKYTDTRTMEISNPLLWSPEHPLKYMLLSSLMNSEGEVLDRVENHFGIRTLDVDPDLGIILNGTPVFIKGIGKHQDYEKLGYAVPDEINRNDVVMIKELGANLLRSHYPLDPSVYDMCDELGIMVWGKIPIMDKINHTPEFLQNSKNMMKELMYQNYNRPSFILWGYACEMFGDMDWYWPKPQDPEAVKENMEKTVEFAWEMENLTRTIDPFRITANDFHTDPTPEYYLQSELTSVNMVNGWNLYQGWYHNNLDSISWAFNTFREYNPDVPFVVAEFGAGSDPRIHSYEPTIFDFSIEYQDRFHEAYLEEAAAHDFVHGLCIWTLVDFQVDGRADAVPHINSKGLLRSDRTPKDAYYLYQAHWSDKPMVHIASRDWTKRKEIVDGDVASRTIRIYSNTEKVTVSLNGTRLGEFPVVDHIAKVEVPFREGVNQLEAMVKTQEGKIRDCLDIDFTFISSDLKNTEFPRDGLCINVGQSRTYFTDDLTGDIWMPDKAYEPGNYGHLDGDYHTEWNAMPAWDGIRQGVGQNIKGTHLDPVFQAFLKDVTSYVIDVPDGSYEVTLCFTEPFSDKQRLEDPVSTGAGDNGNRVFDVRVNDQLLFENLDIDKAYGSSTAVKRSAIVKAAENKIIIRLKPEIGTPVLSGIKILPK